MAKVFSASRLPGLVAVGVVLFAFWPALFGGGSLIAGDFVYNYAAPFDFYQSENFSLETGSTDPINIHSHWAPLAADVRSGDVGWWSSDLAGGQPTMKGGLPVFNLGYLVVPGWFAPGLVAAIRALTAIGLTYGFVRSLGLLRVSALASGIAFAFSGFMVGWMNWPHSSIAALAPGLLWALERLLRDPKLWRAVPLGAVVAAMVWSNFPQVTIYVLLAAAIYAAFRLSVELRTGDGQGATKLKSLALCGSVAVLLAALLASPHLIGFVQYLDWIDTSDRMGSVDSSAGVKYLLTAVAPAIWGHGAFGPGWFGEVNWTEHNAYVGASVLMLGVVGAVTGFVNGDRRRRSAVAAFVVMGALGLLIAYIGGPLSVPVRELTGAASGAMTRGQDLMEPRRCPRCGFRCGTDRAADIGGFEMVASAGDWRVAGSWFGGTAGVLAVSGRLVGRCAVPRRTSRCAVGFGGTGAMCARGSRCDPGPASSVVDKHGGWLGVCGHHWF